MPKRVQLLLGGTGHGGGSKARKATSIIVVLQCYTMSNFFMLCHVMSCRVCAHYMYLYSHQKNKMKERHSLFFCFIIIEEMWNKKKWLVKMFNK